MQVTNDPAVKIATILPMVLARGRTREDLERCIEEYEPAECPNLPPPFGTPPSHPALTPRPTVYDDTWQV